MMSLINLHWTLSSILIQKISYLFQNHWKDRNHIFVQSNWSSIERKLFWKVISDQCFFISQSNSFSLRSLIDSDFVVYMLIHDKLVNKVCQKLEIQFILLAKEKLIRDYNKKLARKTITHKILLNLMIESHKKLTMSMLIADIEHHEAILSKLWMNKNEILLNMRHDTIIFSDQLNISISIFSISSNTKHSS